MRALLLATAALFAFAGTAQAVIVNATDIGASGTTSIQGFVDVNNVAVPIPGLTASLFLQFDGVTGNTWNFDYTITNTSSGNISTARLSSFGLATTPDPIAASSTGLYQYAIVNPSFPNVGGAGQNIDVCFGSSPGTCSGGNGLLPGQSASGEFDLTFAMALSSLSLDSAFARFQSINSGPPFNFAGASGVGINNDLSINPVDINPVPLPAAAWMFLAGIAGLGVLARKKKQAALKAA